MDFPRARGHEALQAPRDRAVLSPAWRPNAALQGDRRLDVHGPTRGTPLASDAGGSRVAGSSGHARVRRAPRHPARLRHCLHRARAAVRAPCTARARDPPWSRARGAQGHARLHQPHGDASDVRGARRGAVAVLVQRSGRACPSSGFAVGPGALPGVTAASEKQGEALARQYLDEARSERRTFECHTSFALGAGGRFTVEKHPRGDVNGQLLVIRSRCTVTEGADGRPVRRNVLVCVPARDPWRPSRRPKPRIFGTQTAFVVGNKAGVDEIDVDEHGRVKVEFRWDRRDLHEGNPTRFVRVSQGWAGLDYGMVMLPRVNEEVIIAYLDGDPDEPVVVGRLHNAWSVAPLKLPAEKTRSIWKSKTSPGGEGFNQIMMEDKKGEELLELHAHRDNLVTVGASQTVGVGGDQKIHVKGERDDHVESAVKEDYDTSLTTTIGGKQETTAEDVVERYASQNTEMAGKKHTKAGAVDEDFRSLETTVEGLHKDKFGTAELEGGDVKWRVGALDWETKGVKWTLGGSGYIKAPSFVIDAPEFKVTNAGSHKEIKGAWETVIAAKKDTTAHKAAFLVSDTKSVYFEQKAFTTSINVGAFKLDVTAIKIDMAGAKLQNNSFNLKKVATVTDMNALRTVIAGIFSIA
ncbi:type VI secretion system Vgr family protein [Sorangium sp. So ce1151]|uniref:type VI secretion system Vgr family protein n=1 Tax=Sorangium sp. So ce1151 TaxID=3133332 RepID=UPI003F5F889A